MDFSPWDWAEIFRLHEAACLIAGVPVSAKRVPNSEELPSGSRPVLVRLATAWVVGIKHKNGEDIDDYPISHTLDVVQTELDGAFTEKDIPQILVRRKELHRWVTAMGIKSAYSFAPFATSFVGADPDTRTETPEPVVVASDSPAKRRPKKQSIEAVSLDYMRKVYQSAQFASAAKFHKHLCTTAGANGSPFEMGTGANARKLFCPAAGSFFDVGTLGKMWPKIRAD